MADTLTFSDIQEDLREALADAYGNQGYVYLNDCSTDTVWFTVENQTGCATLQASYTLDETTDEVTLGDPIQVERDVEVTYTPVEMSMGFETVRKDDAQQLIFGWANVAVTKEGDLVVDSDGEHVPIEDLEAAAYTFTMKFRATGADHAGESRGELVESVVFTEEKIKAMGLPAGSVPLGWWTGFHIDSADDFAKVRAGEKSMFSIQGMARTVAV